MGYTNNNINFEIITTYLSPFGGLSVCCKYKMNVKSFLFDTLSELNDLERALKYDCSLTPIT